MRTGFSIVALSLAFASSLSAQTADPRWSAWLGCWQLVDGKAEVCIAPAGDAVTLTTSVENEPALEQSIRADGAPHPVNDAGCSGTQATEWSRDGQKLFARAELKCGTEPPRRVSGLAFITREGTWLDVQGVEADGRTTVRVRRYRRSGGVEAAPGAAVAARPAAGTSLSLADISEAHAKVAGAVLEAAVAESGARFAGLRGEDLVALDEAGVSDNVIDLMVAQTWPSKFQVERRADSLQDLYPSGFMYPYFWHPGYYGSYRYFYAPFGYAYYPGYYYPGAYYYPGSLIVIGGGVDTPSPQDASGNARAVNGVGYTRVRTREAAQAEADANAQAGNRGRSRSRVVASPSGFTQSGSESGSASSGSSGAAASSGGSDSGRTAVPR